MPDYRWLASSILTLFFLGSTVYFPIVLRGRDAIFKKGVSMGCQNHYQDATSLGAGWFYDWTEHPPNIDGIDSVPMIWGKSHITTTHISGNSGWLLGMNEPDRGDQANMSVFEGAIQWKLISERWRDKKLVSPATSQHGDAWLNEFRSMYLMIYGEYPRMDALAVHCYSRSPDYCIDYIQSRINTAIEWDIDEVWITEFAIYGTDDVIRDQARLISWMNNSPIITRYAYFTNRADCPDAWWDFLSLYRDGVITDLGIYYSTIK